MIAKVSGPGQEISEYEISDREMAVGSTLGAPKATLIVKATGALEKVYSCEAGVDVFGALVLHHWDRRSGIPLLPQPGQFIIHPCAQEHIFELANGVTVHEEVFMLSSTPQGEGEREVDPPAAYFTVELKNDGNAAVEMATYASLRLHGGFSESTTTSYDREINAFVGLQKTQPKLVRIAACSVPATSYEVTSDIAKANAASFPGALDCNATKTCDDPIAIFHFDHRLAPGERAAFSFVLTFSLDGEEATRKALASLPVAKTARATTNQHYDAVLRRAMVVTPNADVNRGVLWAKANILRCEQLTEQGWCFVNDPTRSNNSVGRDTAWFAFGADYLTPHFTAESLRWYIDHLTETGMVVEYFDIRNGKSETYGLNINDDTPLVIIGLWHRYSVTGDRTFLEQVYPQAQRAARYMLSQRDERGLVCCRAKGTADWGIVGWRNVIEGYRLTGATTELNSECYAALTTLQRMATELGDVKTALEFGGEALALRSAMNEHLLDKARGLYYLTLDEDGTPRTDVTCDLVFPVLFGVADRDVSANIVAVLSRPEFWTDAGLHTVPRTDINYGPAYVAGLLGGVWSGPTFWFAAAAASFNPAFMAEALAKSFRHYAEDPHRYNTVPGQFCEWLHGETLTNQGMMLSPWFAPKYLWAALEGAAGLDVTERPPTITPRLPPAWPWIGARDVMVRGKMASWFTVRFDRPVTYASARFPSVAAENTYEEDVTDRVRITGDNAGHIALKRRGALAIMIGNTLDRTITTSVSLAAQTLSGRYLLRSYNSLIGEWTEQHGFDVRRFHDGYPVQVAHLGFCVLELHEEK